jgi:hypothetical protein
VKEPKIGMGATRRNLRAQPKSTNQNENFPKKVCLVPSKCKRAKNWYGGYPTEFADSTKNHKKNMGTSKQPTKTKIFPKKVWLVP